MCREHGSATDSVGHGRPFCAEGNAQHADQQAVHFRWHSCATAACVSVAKHALLIDVQGC